MVQSGLSDGVNGPRALRLALIAIAIVALAVFVWFTIDVFLLIFSGILLAVLVRGLGRRIAEHTPLNLPVSLFVGVAGLIIIFGGSLWFAVNQMIGQASSLFQQLPAALNEIQNWAVQQWWGPWILEQLPTEQILRGAQEPTLTGFLETVSSATSIVTYSVLIAVFGMFLAIDPNVYLRGFLYLLPEERREPLKQAASDVREALETYLLAKVVSMIVIGALVTLGLWLLGIPLAVQLGVLTGLLTFVPIIGQLLAMGAALTLALIAGGTFKVLLVLALYLAVQAVDGYLLKPLFYRHTLSFPPALTLGAQVFMGVLFGGFGVALASPLAISVWVLVRELYAKPVRDAPIAEDDQPEDERRTKAPASAARDGVASHSSN